ncbi:Beta-glucan synthesis-associated protein KRE6 [Seminavis robusta]|uniref:Beta-glucan synthesis-associated protein KRE6 n=1 Tax=Seminavis robusta TaxID=568900 RepID=A0A9N8HDF1_9STRA|nr:Beta-glucan synthesis-associated protein KRE6 [Seminavis robusta]|eukprot:Sro341_g121450.1 Beta-glucan synthesis-associated protein KRE6 (706) ;mRNA; f:36256-38552
MVCYTGKRREGTASAFRVLLCLLLIVAGQASFIDMDTPLDRRTTTSIVDGSVYHLVMSDEFNTDNRTLTDGHDPMWTALDRSDDDASSAGGGSQQFYNSTNVQIVNGSLLIHTTLEKTEWTRFDHVKKKWTQETTYYKSGMVQSWNKFCFTGGIVEVDMILPGHPNIGGLWPAVWMLGNLGRATYEASTNNIWPWSFDKCDRQMQPRQAISACNRQNHYGLHPFQGRGATEIDIIEVMTGDSGGFFAATDPPVALPYADMTLQLAPGIEKNRPQSGGLPKKNETKVHGFTQFQANTWYEGLEYAGNTSINPFFYGTYLAKTKPGEPVTRTAKQAFQADAVGVVHQLTPSHFEKMHTIRLEWQPGPGGRLDWYTKGYQKTNENGTYYDVGDGDGPDWVPVLTIKDEVLKKTMGSQIPIEPTYLIMNTAVSSTWGFPYDVPDWCTKCYDCDDPTCACAFAPGFCEILRQGGVSMKIDSIRVYQSHNASAHVGQNHTLGCDPPEFPTREFIRGHEYRYMRNPPFSYDDVHPLKRIQRGGGACKTDADCGGNNLKTNLTKTYEAAVSGKKRALSKPTQGMGRCVSPRGLSFMFSTVIHDSAAKVCVCNTGFTGPHCLSQAFFEDAPSAEQDKRDRSPFRSIVEFQATPFMLVIVCTLITLALGILVYRVQERKRELHELEAPKLGQPKFVATSNFMGEEKNLLITGTSI